MQACTCFLCSGQSPRDRVRAASLEEISWRIPLSTERKFTHLQRHAPTKARPSTIARLIGTALPLAIFEQNVAEMGPMAWVCTYQRLPRIFDKWAEWANQWRGLERRNSKGTVLCRHFPATMNEVRAKAIEWRAQPTCWMKFCGRCSSAMKKPKVKKDLSLTKWLAYLMLAAEALDVQLESTRNVND